MRALVNSPIFCWIAVFPGALLAGVAASCRSTLAYEELRALDVHRGKASIEWYRAVCAGYRGEMTAGDVDEAVARVRELDAELSRAFSERN